ncbi:HEAT repeat domain-containing protein [Pelagibius marinus]|uniref:HEAT repeat domain-containing protein n=1 Tax=Pelagibius marinus TaxID=2762760 RepID=UPI001872AAB9|nr:HEAT repeat domain-containing protein [Pelagibius marinus]
MSLKEKLALVGWLDPRKDADYQKLAALVRDEEAEIRYEAIERIGANRSRETTDLLLEALDDPDELVRAQCLDELSYRNDLSTDDAGRIRPFLDDESELVRRSAAWALAAARDSSVIPLLKDRLTQVSTAEQGSYCFALTILGEAAYLDRAITLLQADCYQTRCSVANGFADVIDDTNREPIVAALEQAWQTETSRAVWTTIERVMQEIGAWKESPDREGWELIPNISLGPFVFGTEIDEYVDRFAARFKEDPEAGPEEWQTFSLPHSDDYLSVEEGVLVCVTGYKGVIYKGVDLVGLTLAELEKLLGCPPDDIGPTVEYENGEVQTAYDFDDFGLGVWTADDKVVSVSCLDYREDTE